MNRYRSTLHGGRLRRQRSTCARRAAPARGRRGVPGAPPRSHLAAMLKRSMRLEWAWVMPMAWWPFSESLNSASTQRRCVTSTVTSAGAGKARGAGAVSGRGSGWAREAAVGRFAAGCAGCAGRAEDRAAGDAAGRHAGILHGRQASMCGGQAGTHAHTRTHTPSNVERSAQEVNSALSAFSTVTCDGGGGWVCRPACLSEGVLLLPLSVRGGGPASAGCNIHRL